ncbi:MAG: hypothetical protein NT030_07720 [Candidatus Saganbacteria bacterium]|nr:hypothetical protein [Candidatus Saganbacteria bacterium]
MLTKEKALKAISATDFVKKKIGEFLSWTLGYDISSVKRAKLVPIIYYVEVVPHKAPPDGRTVVDIIAAVDDPGGLDNILGVRADLSSIGKLSNSALVDNGLFGDKVPNDGVYTLQTSISEDIAKGPREIPVAALNKDGWLALSKAVLDVEKSPFVTESSANPSEVQADGKTIVMLKAKVENPGGVDEIRYVTVDLTEIGGAPDIPMWNNGTQGDAVAGDLFFTVETVVRKGVAPGQTKLKIAVENVHGDKCAGEIFLTVK